LIGLCTDILVRSLAASKHKRHQAWHGSYRFALDSSLWHITESLFSFVRSVLTSQKKHLYNHAYSNIPVFITNHIMISRFIHPQICLYLMTSSCKQQIQTLPVQIVPTFYNQILLPSLHIANLPRCPRFPQHPQAHQPPAPLVRTQRA
jgi:hypothetical protein